jgi:hypothetical protein
MISRNQTLLAALLLVVTLSQSTPNCVAYSASNNCIACSAGYYIDIMARCILATRNCATYSVNTGSCTSCLYGYTLSGINCIDPNCLTINPLAICTACSPGYYVDNGYCASVNRYCRISTPNGRCFAC